MRIAYFPNYVAQNGVNILHAFLNGCARYGISTVEDSLDADAAVIWSVLWAGKMASNRPVYEHFTSRGLPVICIEVGALDRGHTWKIALNNVNALGYYGHQQDLDWDRPRKLGIELKHNTLTHNRILVAGQHKQSLQLQGVDQEDWYIQKINEYAGGREVVVRPHPRCPLNRQRFPKDVVWQTPKKLANTYDSFDIEWKFDAVINYNSGPGIQAAIAGIKPVVDSTSLAYGIVDREKWLVEICHTEYTTDEIERGTWAKRIGLEK